MCQLELLETVEKAAMTFVRQRIVALFGDGLMYMNNSRTIITHLSGEISWFTSGVIQYD